jgi:outer membrane protein TolC
MLEKTDADQLSVQVSMLDNTLQSAEMQIELAHNMLRFNLGIENNNPIALTQGLDEIMGIINFETTLVQPFQLESNLDYQLILNTEQILEQQVKMQKMNYLPTVSGFYSHTEKILKPNFDMTPKNIIGVKASIPIFSSSVRKSKVAQAEIQFESLLNNKRLLNNQLLLQEKQLRFNLNTTLKQFDNQKQNVEVSDRVFKSLSLKYEQGMISSLDLTTANSNYLKSESDYITALMRLLDAEIALRKLFYEL